jgi:hypothetical protein
MYRYNVRCVVLLVLAALKLDYTVGLAGFQTIRESRGAPPTLLEWIIFAYVLCKSETLITHSTLLKSHETSGNLYHIETCMLCICKTVDQFKSLICSIYFIYRFFRLLI